MKKSTKEAKNKFKDLATPKGMRDIEGDDYYNFQGFFEKAQEIAVYYGFKPIETPIMEYEKVFAPSLILKDIVELGDDLPFK